jgi:hypothetical protein
MRVPRKVEQEQQQVEDLAPTNYAGQVASQETEVRDAEHWEKPAAATVAQFEEIKPSGVNHA